MTVPDRENEAWGREAPGVPPTVMDSLKADGPWSRHVTPRRAGPHTQALPRLLTLGFQGPERTCQDRDRPITPEPMRSPAAPEVAGATCGGPEGAAKLTLEQGAIRCPTGDTAVPKFSRDVAQTTQNLHTHKWLHGCPRHFSAGLLPSLLAGGPRPPKLRGVHEEGFQF